MRPQPFRAAWPAVIFTEGYLRHNIISPTGLSLDILYRRTARGSVAFLLQTAILSPGYPIFNANIPKPGTVFDSYTAGTQKIGFIL
jgi:hypothetical protein